MVMKSKAAPLSNSVANVPEKTGVKIRAEPVQSHARRAGILTLLCFFTVGPCWALYKSFEVRRLLARGETDAAQRLSNQIGTVLLISTIIGGIVWLGILFCSVGLLLTGKLLLMKFI